METKQIERVSIPLAQGFMTEQPPVWDDHRRSKRWCATVVTDPRSPGGLARTFHDKGARGYYYDTSGMSLGDVLEIAADYYSASGRRSENRGFFVVEDITPEALILIPVGSEAEGRALVGESRPAGATEVVEDLLNRLAALDLQGEEYQQALQALKTLRGVL